MPARDVDPIAIDTESVYWTDGESPGSVLSVPLDSDCMVIASGMLCPGDACAFCCGGNATINVDGKARYEQTLAPLSDAWSDLFGLPTSVCHCPNCAGWPGPVCTHGVCAMNQ